jgi:hypothetical protein
VVTVTDLDTLQALLGSRGAGEAAFVAIGSLSETPLALREAVRPAVAAFDAFLLFYAARHDDLDNRAYFAGWPAAFPSHAWSHVEAPHFDKSASYLFGIRRRATSPGSG